MKTDGLHLRSEPAASEVQFVQQCSASELGTAN